MALASNVLTLADVAKRRDPNGKAATIVELLSQNNEILDDMLFMEGNLPTGHRITVRTGLPTVYWRLLNQGIQPSKSTSAQITEGCGLLESWSEIDQKVAELGGNVGQNRINEAKAFVEAMGQEHASTLFYGNSSVSPEEFNGLAIRYSSLSANNAQNIVNCQGSDPSDNSSIWLVGWGEKGVHGIYPQGSMAGLQQKDFGLQVAETAAGIGGSRMAVYREQFTWDTGLALKDWRYVARAANIDMSALVNQSGHADLIDAMTKLTYRLPSLSGGVRPVFYMNRSLLQYLDIQCRKDVKAGGQLNYENVGGKRIASFRGIPIKLVDALLGTEAAVS